MNGSLPIAVAAIVAGGVVIEYGVRHTRTAFAGTGSTSSPTSSGQPVGGTDMAAFRDALQARGLTKVAAAGVVGNIWQESSGNPNTPGGGLAQWIGKRWANLVSFAGTSHPNATQQLDFLVNELASGTQGLTVAQLNAASTPQQAATLFSQQFERPGNPQLANRINYANQAYNA